MKKILLLVSILITLMTSEAIAEFDEGSAAFVKGDYSTALKEWKPLADQGNAKAQNNLGVLYDFGLGVPRDYKLAAEWHRKAAEQGNALAQL